MEEITKEQIKAYKERRPDGVKVVEFEDGKKVVIGRLKFENFRAVFEAPNKTEIGISLVKNSILDGDFTVENITEEVNEPYFLELAEICEKFNDMPEVEVLKDDLKTIAFIVKKKRYNLVKQVTMKLLREKAGLRLSQLDQNISILQDILEDKTVKKTAPAHFFAMLSEIKVMTEKKSSQSYEL